MNATAREQHGMRINCGSFSTMFFSILSRHTIDEPHLPRNLGENDVYDLIFGK